MLIMNLKIILFFLLILCINVISGQNDDKEKIRVTGVVKDINNNPIKGAIIFVDSVETNTKTNRKGKYKIFLDPNSKKIAAYAPEHGLLSCDYSREKIASFIFRDGSKPLSVEDMVVKMHYVMIPREKDNTNWYSKYSSILDILEQRFPSVRVIDGRIVIGKGINVLNTSSDPLILVDDQRIDTEQLSYISTNDVKHIKVVRGSETAIYGGLNAANGVIIITLKKQI